jgi:hypothetical protein
LFDAADGGLGDAEAAGELGLGEFGVWDGLDQQERRNLKRRQHRRKAAIHARDSSAGGAA